MQVLSVSRLSHEESDRNRREDPDRGSLPDWIGVSEVCRIIGKSDRTLSRYRAIAFEQVGLYWRVCLENNPGYLAGLTTLPDKPPFNKLQAAILIEISDLFDGLGNERLVVSSLNRKYIKPENLQE